MVLYDFELLAECYAVRLLAALLRAPLTVRTVDFYPGRAHEDDAFLSLNPLGTLPVLDAGDVVLRDWQAVLVFLAAQFDQSRQWLPREDPAKLAAVQEWLGVARRLGDSAGVVRIHDTIGTPADAANCRAEAHRLLRHLERHLWFNERAGDRWLVSGAQPSIADVAVFVHVVLSEEGGIERMDYPAVRRWTDRLRRLPDFQVSSGVFPLPPLDQTATQPAAM